MKLQRKQKIILFLILVALAYIAWQVYDIFGDSFTSKSSSTPVATQPATMPSIANQKATTTTTTEVKVSPPAAVVDNTAAKITDNQKPTTGVATTVTQPSAPAAAATTTHVVSTNAPTTPAIPQVQVQTQITQAPVATPVPPQTTQSTLPMPMLNSDQQQYLQLLNQYQMLRLQRQIVNEKAQIASAEEKIAETYQKTSQMSGKPSSYSQFDTSGNVYKLIYLDNQSGQWTATLSKQGQYYEVVAGDVLPDGSRIITVTRDGINMVYQNQYYELSFYGMNLIKNSDIPNGDNIPSAKQLLAPSLPPKAPTTNNQNNSMPIAPSDQKTNGDVSHAPAVAAPSSHQAEAKTTKKEKIAQTAVHNPTTVTKSKTAESVIPLTPKQKQELATMKQIIGQTAENKSVTEKKKGEKTAIKMVANSAKQKLALNSQINQNQNQQLPEQKIENPKPVKQIKNVHENKANKKQGYTIQLLASAKKSDVTQFIKSHNLKNNTRVVEAKVHGETWYLLLYGDYEQATQANADMAKLPSSLKGTHPWVRPLASIQSPVNNQEAV